MKTTTHPLLLYGVLFALLLASVLGALTIGQGSLADTNLRHVLLELRAARLLAAFAAGAALAVGGVVVQGLFRNPLASPSILGTTSGAVLGGRLVLLLFHVLSQKLPYTPELFVPVGCVVGALGALLLLLAVARARDDLVVLLLTGFLLSALFISIGGFVVSLGQDRWELARAMIVFSLGDVSSASMLQVRLALPLTTTGIGAAWIWGRALDAMLSGEQEAATLGVEVNAVRRWVVIWVALLTGAAVAVGGSIGFVGLVVPHGLRPFVGAAHRRLIPAAMLLGGIFVVACDVLCRAFPAESELPLGVVTGLVGAPVFLLLLVRSRRGVQGG